VHALKTTQEDIELMRRSIIRAAPLAILIAACGDSPLERTDAATSFRVVPANVVVDAGGSAKIGINVVDRYGVPINTSVQATPCDDNISADIDPSRTGYEFPERFIVTAQDTLGTSCLLATGAGITVTIDVSLIPADIMLFGPGFLFVGDTATFDVQFLATGGIPVQGLTTEQVSFESSDENVATVNGEGFVTGITEGTATTTVRLADSQGGGPRQVLRTACMAPARQQSAPRSRSVLRTRP
jgi:hypothetical protein